MKIELRKGLVAYDTENKLLLDRKTIVTCGCGNPKLLAMGSINAPHHYISMVECQNCGNFIFTKSEV